MLAAAETACKAAKDRGRNRVEVYQQSDVSIVRRFADIGIAEQLREAIDAADACTWTRSSSCRSPPPRARARTTSCCCA